MILVISRMATSRTCHEPSQLKRLVAVGGTVKIVEVPSPVPRPREVLVRSIFSAISTGTELTIIKESGQPGGRRSQEYPGRRPYGPKRRSTFVRALHPDPRTGIEDGASLGYSLAGRVTAIGQDVTGIGVGDLVACGGSQCAVHAEEVAVPASLATRVPNRVRAESASFVTLGSIALHAFREAHVQIGETIVVFGLGVLGLIVTQVARAAGVYVVALDRNPARLELALRLGATQAIWSTPSSLIRSVRMATDGYGADAVILAVGGTSSKPLNLSLGMCRDRGRVVGLGDFPIHAARSLMAASESSIVITRAYGPGRYDPYYEEGSIDYPIGYVRWTERRNMDAFLRALEDCAFTVDGLAPRTFPLAQAAEAYEYVRQGTAPTALLTYLDPD